jgi:hypothetical protein
VRPDDPTKTNAGAGEVKGARRNTVTAEAEYAAFDQLGPALRDLMNYGMLSYDSQSTLKKMRTMGLDPQRPDDDEKITTMLKPIDDRIRAQFRQENEDAANSGDIGRAIARGFHRRAVARADAVQRVFPRKSKG